jgi:hypothetical protein
MRVDNHVPRRSWISVLPKKGAAHASLDHDIYSSSLDQVQLDLGGGSDIHHAVDLC